MTTFSVLIEAMRELDPTSVEVAGVLGYVAHAVPQDVMREAWDHVRNEREAAK